MCIHCALVLVGVQTERRKTSAVLGPGGHWLLCASRRREESDSVRRSTGGGGGDASAAGNRTAGCVRVPQGAGEAAWGPLYVAAHARAAACVRIVAATSA